MEIDLINAVYVKIDFPKRALCGVMKFFALESDLDNACFFVASQLRWNNNYWHMLKLTLGQCKYFKKIFGQKSSFEKNLQTIYPDAASICLCFICPLLSITLYVSWNINLQYVVVFWQIGCFFNKLIQRLRQFFLLLKLS